MTSAYKTTGNQNTGGSLHGGDVYRNRVRLDFSVNLNSVAMPDEITEAMREGLTEIHQYPDPSQQKLREGIAAYEGISPENVICGNGASELIMAAVHAVKPRKALITAPCYAGYAVALAAEDAEIMEYPLNENDDFSIDKGFPDHITPDTDMVFIADPNNPNGRLLAPEMKEAIIKKCSECGTALVIDECFYPLTEAGREQRQITDQALHLRAFTKTFAIPGIRLGYMITNDAELLKQIKRHLPEWNVSRIAERTGEAAIKVLAETGYLERSVNLIAEEREFLRGKLAELGIKTYRSDTNYLLFRSIPDLYDRLLEKGILVRRCSNFSGLDETYFRIAVRTHAENEELLRAFREVL